MKKYLFLYAVAVTALLVCGYGRYRRENRRLTQNQHALAAGIERYRTRLGQEAASVQALRLRCAEFERLRAGDAEHHPPPRHPFAARSRGDDSHGHESRCRCIRTPVRDTVVVRLRDTLVVRDTLRLFRWRDPWVTVEGRIRSDSATAASRASTRCGRSYIAFRGVFSSSVSARKPCGRRSSRRIRTRGSSIR